MACGDKLTNVDRFYVGLQHSLVLSKDIEKPMDQWEAVQVQEWLEEEIGVEGKVAKMALFQRITGKVLTDQWRKGFGSLMIFLIDSFGFKEHSKEI